MRKRRAGHDQQPSRMREIIGAVTANREALRELLGDDNLDAILALAGDVLEKRDRARSDWEVREEHGLKLHYCKKCGAYGGLYPTSYCASCGAIMSAGRKQT